MLGLEQAFNKYRLKKQMTMLAHTLTALPPKSSSRWPKNYKHSREKNNNPICTRKIWKRNQKNLRNFCNKQSTQPLIERTTKPACLASKKMGYLSGLPMLTISEWQGWNRGKLKVRKKISVMTEMPITDTRRYTSATKSQRSWPRFSALLHPMGNELLMGEAMPIREERTCPSSCQVVTIKRGDALQQSASKASHQRRLPSFSLASLQALNGN